MTSPAYGEDDRKPAKQRADQKKPDATPAPPAPPPRTPGPDDAKVTALLEKIAAGPDTATRMAAIEELTKLAPGAIDAIDDFLKRPHQVSIADRRTVLLAIKASVPDKTGKFPTPQREDDAKRQQAEDRFDWLGGLLALDAATPNLGEVLADVAAIRALVASKEIRAAGMIFEAAFRPDTMLYRDECGRSLRKMEPYSIPALTRESQGANDRRRYATWQLERLDRQEPNKAIAATAGDETITIALLDVFRTTRHREAVHAVWTVVNADSPRVRAAAREAWMAYITGPPPPPAPRKKLQLPGGKLTKKPKAMWLTSRELADNELRKAANELLHEDYPLEDPSIDDDERTKKSVKIDLEATTKRLFKHLDDARATSELAQWTEAKAKADAGDLATATTMIDRLLVANPEHGQRVEMAKIYVTLGKQLEAKKEWAAASAAFSKAHGLDPKGAGATDALAAHHYTLGKSLEAAGKDGSPDFRRAVSLKPDYAPAKSAAAAAEGSRPVWMLYSALGAALLALLLFGAGMLKRRA